MSGSRRWQFKICLIGDGYVGKTSIRRKYLGQGFRSNYIPSLGVDFAQKTVMYDDDESVRLVIWDIAGQPGYKTIRSVYYKGSLGSLLVFDIARPATYENARRWLRELWNNSGRGKIPVILIGNKIEYLISNLSKIFTIYSVVVLMN